MKNPLKASSSVIALSVLLGFLLGVTDIFIDVFVFHKGTVFHQFLRPTAFEVYIRGFMMILSVAFGVVVSRIVVRLEMANEEIKLFKGILPVCSSCKKVRDEDNCWVSLETYVLDCGETKFSHGVCPDCQLKLYGKKYTEI